MKIAIVIANNTLGGAQKVTCHLAKYISSQPESSALIISLKKSKKAGYDMSGYNYVALSEKHIIISLRKCLIENGIDVVITMGVPICIYTIPACFGLKTRIIVSERNDPSHFAGKNTIKFLSRILMKAADGFVFQTEDAKTYYNLSKTKRTAVIPNPLPDIASLPTNRFEGDRDKAFVTAGRLIPQKNHKVLLEAFKIVCDAYKDYKLLLWGEGDCCDELKAYSKKLHIEDKVFFCGTTDNLMGDIYCKTAFVLTSDFEGMPNVLMEAMASGLPCISTDCPCGGPHALIENNINGILVPVNNAEKIASAMKYIIENPEDASNMGRRAFEIRNFLNPDIICKRWFEFIVDSSASSGIVDL